MPAAITVLMGVLSVVLLMPRSAGAQAFWAKDTPKLPMAKSWLVDKAKLPGYTPPRTPDGVPGPPGHVGRRRRRQNSYLEDHDVLDVDVTGPGKLCLRSRRRQGALHSVGAGQT